MSFSVFRNKNRLSHKINLNLVVRPFDSLVLEGSHVMEKQKTSLRDVSGLSVDPNLKGFLINSYVKNYQTFQNGTICMHKNGFVVVLDGLMKHEDDVIIWGQRYIKEGNCALTGCMIFKREYNAIMDFVDISYSVVATIQDDLLMVIEELK